MPLSRAVAYQAGQPWARRAGAGYRYLLGGSYRGMWWSLHNEHGAFAARGVHGQTIYIAPTLLPAYQAVAEYLMEKTQP